jgi:hypothetical protein
MSTLIFVGDELGCLSAVEICVGWMAGYATGYEEVDQSSFLGAATLRYGWVELLIVPTEVTALVISIPLEAFKK